MLQIENFISKTIGEVVFRLKRLRLMLNKLYLINPRELIMSKISQIILILFVTIIIITNHTEKVLSQEHSKTPPSTNPAKPMVEQLKLPNYDTALDSLDYHAPLKKIYAMVEVPDINWPWKTDPIRQRKRIEAVRKLLQNRVFARDIDNIAKGSYLPLDSISWPWQYDETNTEQLITTAHTVNDDLLVETLPFIPEIRTCGLSFTKITDKGLKALFYLPLLKRLWIETVEPETHPLPITDKGIDLISKHPSLEGISMRNLNITDNALKSIAENSTNIKRIDFEGENISDKGIFYLGKMKSLRSLSLSRRGGIPIDTIRPPAPITSQVFEYLSQCSDLAYIGFNFYDFSIEPAKTLLKSIQQFKKLRMINFRNTKLHPLILKSLCDLKTIQDITMLFDNYSVMLEFDEENPISYEKVMYRLKQNNQVPEYYLELEKPYFDEFYSRKWTSSDGRFMHEACFINLKDNQVILKLKGETKEITVPFEKLSKEDQKYV
ncbi:MAG: hypothetical protein LBE12_18970, partial [Planctomycetaceae bacterium]|nr:hypothetical protein [Planctomycetaceae bacterium]